MTFPWIPLIGALFFAVLSTLLGWVFVDLSWGLEHAYFGVGVFFFFWFQGAVVSNLLQKTDDTLAEKFQKMILRKSIFGTFFSTLVILIVSVGDLFVSMVYWPATFASVALLGSSRLVKLSDLQNLARVAAGKRPLILSATMLLQNGMLFASILAFPQLREYDLVRTSIILAMIANVLLLVQVAIRPVEAQMRQTMSPGQAASAFVFFIVLIFLSDALLLYCFRLSFNNEASLGQAALDLVSMGKFNPAIMKLTDDAVRLLGQGEAREALRIFAALPSDLIFSWCICILFGAVVATRGIGVLLFRSQFHRTEVDKISGAHTALLSNDMGAAKRFVSELPKTHYLATLYEIQVKINASKFDEAMDLAPLFVRRKRHALELDDDVLLGDRERWFVLVNLILALDEPKLWIDALVWSIAKTYLQERDFVFLLYGRIFNLGRSELETELRYIVAVAQSLQIQTPMVAWLADVRDFVRSGRMGGAMLEEKNEQDKVALLTFTQAIHLQTVEDILRSKIIRLVPREWSDMILSPFLEIDMDMILDRIMKQFETSDPLDRYYCLIFLKALVQSFDDEALEDPTGSQSDVKAALKESAAALIKERQEQILGRYGESQRSIDSVFGHFSSLAS